MEEDPKAIEAALFADLKLQGAIVLTSFLDQFEYYPYKGLGDGGDLEVQSGLKLHEKSLSNKDRTKVFKITYGEDKYDARLFARVAEGMRGQSEFFSPCIIYMFFIKSLQESKMNCMPASANI